MAYNQSRNTQSRKPQNRNNQTQKSGWRELCDGISVAGDAKRFSLSWHGAVIHGCRIVNGKNGPFIGWPSYKGSDGEYHNNAYVYAPAGSHEEADLGLVIESLSE